ncbi:ATP-binding cassette domain-containing protein [Actinomadura soli]|uniref:ATP-binding cassette domain-containing protein n=1 Tax=Actinomadura soli TaxID=2508997 RepID=UPI002E32A6BC|nr:ATP-binding cassette domain-containing protein [Actinomadura soli]
MPGTRQLDQRLTVPPRASTRSPPARHPPTRPLPAPRGDLLQAAASASATPRNYPWGLDGDDLELRPDRRVALLGPSAEGKSTLAHLLLRFRDPDQGTIHLDGHDLRDYAQDDIRQAICLIDQHAHLSATAPRQVTAGCAAHIHMPIAAISMVHWKLVTEDFISVGWPDVGIRSCDKLDRASSLTRSSALRRSSEDNSRDVICHSS